MNLLSKMLLLGRLFDNRTAPARGRTPAHYRPGLLALEDRTVPAAPANDLFADARLLTGTFDWDTGSNVEATGAGEPTRVADPVTAQSGNSDPLNTVWWRWTAPASGTVEVNTFESDFDTQLAVYTGDDLGSLVVVRANDDALSGDEVVSLQSRVVFEAVEGTTYHIAVDGFSDAVGNVRLSLGMTPPNDAFAGATVVGTETTLAGSNILATAETGERASGDTNGAINSVWWSWTAAETGPVEVNTLGSNFDTILAVYTGPSVGALTFVTANDDIVDRVVLQSRVTFDAVAGTTYHFTVDGFLDETGVVTLNVLDASESDRPPTVSDQTFGIDENRVGGTVVGVVEASDPEGEALTYAIVSGNTDGAFFLDPATGELSVVNGAAIDFETNPTFALLVRVTEAGEAPQFSEATVTVNVRDVNEVPVVADQAFAIDENSEAGTVVGTVLATDEDRGQTLTYTVLSGNEAGAFLVDPATGLITVADAALLDFETTRSFTLGVEVSDSASPSLSARAVVRVAVNDLDETGPNRAPVVEDQTLSVNEGSRIGAVVGDVAAADPDLGQVLTFAIVGGNESGAFAIDPATGRVTVANPSLLNFETNPIFTLTVEVTDNGIPTLSDSATVTVHVANVNEAPVLDTRGSLALDPVNKGDVNNPGTLVSDLLLSSNRPRITDPDAGAVQGIAVIAADTRHGTWQFSTDGGATWQSLGAVSDGSARLLASDALTRIRFVPNGSFHGTLRRAITFRAWDQTSGVNGGLGDATTNGGSSAYSTATEIASLRVRSATEQILLLAVEVHDLRRADVLTSGQAYDLQSKLVGAVKKTVCGDTFAATCYLEEFIARVREFGAAGVLTQDVCDDLCASAEAIIDSLS